jgi:hypothetical protein
MNQMSKVVGAVAVLGVLLAANSAQAQWAPRYRVTSSYSLPSVPYQFNPVVVPVVQPTTAFSPIIVNQPAVFSQPVVVGRPVVVGQPVISQPVVVGRPVVVGQPIVAAPIVVRRGLFRRPVIVAPAAAPVVVQQPAFFVP